MMNRAHTLQMAAPGVLAEVTNRLVVRSGAAAVWRLAERREALATRLPERAEN